MNEVTYIYIYLFGIMRFAILIIYLGFLQCGHSNTAVRICIPDEIVHWEKEPFEQHILKCLANNFAWLPDTKTIHPFVSAYINVTELATQADIQDDTLFYRKRSFMTALRETKLKVTHHIHAIRKCADIAHKMPTTLMSAYSNEAQLMQNVAKLWNTHIKQDIQQCQRVLQYIVRNQHKMTISKLKYAQTQYQTSLQDVANARQRVQQQIDYTLQERKKLISMIHI